MTDVGSHHFVKGGSKVLIPQPSDDRHDPLNWSPLWKALCITAATSVSFSQGFGPLSLAPMFPDYIKEFDSNLTDVRASIPRSKGLGLISSTSWRNYDGC